MIAVNKKTTIAKLPEKESMTVKVSDKEKDAALLALIKKGGRSARPDLSEEEKLQFQQFMASGDFSESALLSLPENVLKKIIPTSTYEGVLVTTEDKIELLRQVDKIKEVNNNDDNLAIINGWDLKQHRFT